MPRIAPPRPLSRPDQAGLWQRLRLFRQDLFRSQPERLYSAHMAVTRTPMRNSALINDLDLVDQVLDARAADFPKSEVMARGLRPLLGRSVFVTNDGEWARQRRLIDPAFAAGRLRESFAPMLQAAQKAAERLSPGRQEIEAETAHFAADVIFRTLFSVPISSPQARSVYDAFRRYQRSQPILSLRDLAGLPEWLPRLGGDGRAARDIRALLAEMVTERAALLAQGQGPADLATEIMSARDPADGRSFDAEEMADQVAIFFLAGHETSASALAWALYCIASDTEVQAAAMAEIDAVLGDREPRFADLSRLRFLRDVVRETLRLYPPVPVLLRQARGGITLRGRRFGAGSLMMVAPWYLGRHQRHWQDPDLFDPWRWQSGRVEKSAWLPFSRGPRVCVGAGFAMMEAVLALVVVLRRWRIEPALPDPVPVAHLTLRSENGIYLSLSPR